MLEDAFSKVYTKFKLSFYKKIFNRFEQREATLTAVETFCVEAIYALSRPTINEFAQFVRISPANATYKINSLVKKGYVVKIRSQHDKREYYLDTTEKFMNYYALTSDYVKVVIGRMKERFSEKDIKKFESMLEVICSELMPEVTLKRENT